MPSELLKKILLKMKKIKLSLTSSLSMHELKLKTEKVEQAIDENFVLLKQ